MQVFHAYRVHWLAVLLAGAVAVPAFAIDTTGQLAVGDSVEKVRTTLGEPRGSIRSGAYELLQYDRGRVEIRDGLVIAVDLVSAEEAAAQRQTQAEEFRAAQERRAHLREQRRIEGLDVRDRAMNSAEFMASSGERQVEFWENFRRRYPDVSVEVEYAAALNQRDADYEKAESERRLANMEHRVAAAEDRARNAEAEAQDARRDARRRYVYYAPPYVNCGYPAACPPHANPSPYTPTYPTTVYPYSHGYSYWGYPNYAYPATASMSSSTRSSGLRVNVSF